MTKKYAIVETIQSFKHVYAIELKDGQTVDDVLEHVRRLEAEELTQQWLGETVIGMREGKLKDVTKIARDYMFDTWTDEQIDERLVNRYENRESESDVQAGTD
jgi:hypothetical protein